MKPGDICEIEIERIGVLQNSIKDQVLWRLVHLAQPQYLSGFSRCSNWPVVFAT
jgi:hypothetical protein